MYFRFFMLRSRDKRSDHSRRRFNQSFLKYSGRLKMPNIDFSEKLWYTQ